MSDINRTDFREKHRRALALAVLLVPMRVVGVVAQANTLAPSRSVAWQAADIRQVRAEGSLLFLPPGTRIEILKDRVGRFLGLGHIEIMGVTVRQGSIPFTVQVVGQGGPMIDEHVQVFLDKVDVDKGPQQIKLRTRLAFPDGTTDRIDWHLGGEKWSIDGHAANGFSYWFEYQSAARRVHRVVERSSWCLGDGLEGLLFLEQSEGYGRSSRALVLGPATEIKPQSPLMPQKETPESRQAVGDYLDFLSATNASVARFVSEPALTFRDLFRNPGDPEVQSSEEYVTPLTLRFRTPRMTVLLYPQGGVNAWFKIRDAVTEHLRNAADLHPEPPLPWVGIPSFDVGDWAKEVDRRLDFYSRLGFKRLWKWSLWKTNWSEWDRLSENDRRLGVKSISHSVLELDWASKLTAAQVEELCRGAGKRGMDVVLWFPTAHLSPASPLLKENPQWRVHRRDGKHFGYVYDELVGVFHPAGYTAYALSRLRTLKRQVGFGGLFFDSAQVFGFDVIDYGKPDWPNQYRAMLDFLRSLNREGLNVRVECLSPFAVPASTGFLQKPESDPEFLLYKTNPHWGGPQSPVTPERYFRMVAFMALPLLVEDLWWKDAALQRLGGYVNQAYDRRVQHMDNCALLPEDEGTLWWDKSRREGTLFAFKSGWVDAGSRLSYAAEVMEGSPAKVAGQRVLVDAYRVYELRKTR